MPKTCKRGNGVRDGRTLPSICKNAPEALLTSQLEDDVVLLYRSLGEPSIRFFKVLQGGKKMMMWVTLERWRVRTRRPGSLLQCVHNHLISYYLPMHSGQKYWTQEETAQPRKWNEGCQLTSLLLNSHLPWSRLTSLSLSLLNGSLVRAFHYL